MPLNPCWLPLNLFWHYDIPLLSYKLHSSKHNSGSLFFFLRLSWFSTGNFCPFPSGLYHWDGNNHKITPIPVKKPLGIWVNIFVNLLWTNSIPSKKAKQIYVYILCGIQYLHQIRSLLWHKYMMQLFCIVHVIGVMLCVMRIFHATASMYPG